ncbi:hypothetical protein BDR26DRAFT_873439 [Obelidium mucronatum]|nr:hypothetical protein BDR26DRAFT_873439 [Obelidium mucronatum]
MSSSSSRNTLESSDPSSTSSSSASTNNKRRSWFARLTQSISTRSLPGQNRTQNASDQSSASESLETECLINSSSASSSVERNIAPAVEPLEAVKTHSGNISASRSTAVSTTASQRSPISSEMTAEAEPDNSQPISPPVEPPVTESPGLIPRANCPAETDNNQMAANIISETYLRGNSLHQTAPTTNTTPPETPPFLRYLIQRHSSQNAPSSTTSDILARRNAVDYTAAMDILAATAELSQPLPERMPRPESLSSWTPENPWAASINNQRTEPTGTWEETSEPLQSVGPPHRQPQNILAEQSRHHQMQQSRRNWTIASAAGYQSVSQHHQHNMRAGPQQQHPQIPQRPQHRNSNEAVATNNEASVTSRGNRDRSNLGQGYQAEGRMRRERPNVSTMARLFDVWEEMQQRRRYGRDGGGELTTQERDPFRANGIFPEGSESGTERQAAMGNLRSTIGIYRRMNMQRNEDSMSLQNATPNLQQSVSRIEQIRSLMSAAQQQMNAAQQQQHAGSFPPVAAELGGGVDVVYHDTNHLTVTPRDATSDEQSTVARLLSDDDEIPEIITRSSSASAISVTLLPTNPNTAPNEPSNNDPYDPVSIFESYINAHILSEAEKRAQEAAQRQQAHQHSSSTTTSIQQNTNHHPTSLSPTTLQSFKNSRNPHHPSSTLQPTKPPPITIPPSRYTKTIHLRNNHHHQQPFNTHTFTDDTPPPHILQQDLTQETEHAVSQLHAIRTSGTGLARLLDVNGCPVAPAGWEHVSLVMKVLCGGHGGGGPGSSSSSGNGDGAASVFAAGAASRHLRRRNEELSNNGGSGSNNGNQDSRNQRRRLGRQGGGGSVYSEGYDDFGEW